MRKSPLKPQQKLHHLRMNIIPKFLHRLALGRITKGLLQSFDSNILSFVRELLDLPMDIPVSFYYNNIKDGGLGIPFLEKAIPKSMIKRASIFRDSNDPTTGTTSFQNLLCLCCTILNVTPIEADLSLDIHKQLRSDLYRTIDGSALSEFRTNSSGQIWLNGITNIIFVKVRIGRLATLENYNRGREVNKKCRKCKRVNETIKSRDSRMSLHTNLKTQFYC